MAQAIIKKYIIIEKTDEEGKKHQERYCDGFTAIELLGLLEFIQLEVVDQIRGTIKPDTIKRQVIIDE